MQLVVETAGSADSGKRDGSTIFFPSDLPHYAERLLRESKLSPVLRDLELNFVYGGTFRDASPAF